MKKYWQAALLCWLLFVTSVGSVFAQGNNFSLSLQSASETTGAAAPATLRLLNRDIATLRAPPGWTDTARACGACTTALS